MQIAILQPDQKAQERMNATFLDDKGYIKLLPSEVFLREDPSQLRIWCTQHAIYGVPTIELVAWLRERIGSQSTIEIGAGNACLGLHLGIRSTDSYIQNDPLMRLYYGFTNQPISKPPIEVFKYDAKHAIKVFNPKVVIASWVTQLFVNGIDQEGQAQASIYGVDETALLRKVKCYIFVGNENSHGQKRILAQPHQTFKFPWLVSRAADPTKNVIYVWDSKMR